MSNGKSPTSFSLATLEETGSTVGGAVQKEIEWHVKGKSFKATVNVMPMGYNTMMDQARLGDHVDVLVRRVCVSVVDDSGAPILTPAHIMGDPATGIGRMTDTLFLALISAINEVNSYGVK